MAKTLVAAVQLTSGADLARNLARAAALIAEAAARGARLVALPENFAFLAEGEQDKLAIAEGIEPPHGPILAAMAEAARRAGVWLVLGGFPERGPSPERLFNSCLVLDAEGAVRARYRKIHLFDVEIPDGATYRESRCVAAGDQPALADTPAGRLGLSVCYDVRFPELYRAYAREGATLLVVPAAFTVYTGRDHWHTLLRARAIENQCYVIAPAQWGQVTPRRQCYGHSLIVDPWGTIVAEAPDGEGVVLGEVDGERLERVRRELPALGHRRL